MKDGGKVSTEIILERFVIMLHLVEFFKRLEFFFDFCFSILMKILLAVNSVGNKQNWPLVSTVEETDQVHLMLKTGGAQLCV